MRTTMITGSLVALTIAAIAVLTGTGHAVPSVLTELASGLVVGHFAISIPGGGQLSVTLPQAPTTGTTSQAAVAASSAPSAAAVPAASYAAPPAASSAPPAA